MRNELHLKTRHFLVTKIALDCVTEVTCVTNQSLTMTSIWRTFLSFPLKFVISRFSIQRTLYLTNKFGRSSTTSLNRSSTVLHSTETSTPCWPKSDEKLACSLTGTMAALPGVTERKYVVNSHLVKLSFGIIMKDLKTEGVICRLPGEKSTFNSRLY